MRQGETLMFRLYVLWLPLASVAVTVNWYVWPCEPRGAVTSMIEFGAAGLTDIGLKVRIRPPGVICPEKVTALLKAPDGIRVSVMSALEP
jgi:hypothetical protein